VDCIVLTHLERKIIRMLMQHKMCLMDISKELKLSNLTVQKVIENLEAKGFINSHLGLFSINKSSHTNLQKIFNSETMKKIESNEILETWQENSFKKYYSNDLLKIHSLECREAEFQVLSNHYNAIEKLIQEIKNRQSIDPICNDLSGKDRKKIFAIHGYHFENNHWEITKKKFINESTI